MGRRNVHTIAQDFQDAHSHTDEYMLDLALDYISDLKEMDVFEEFLQQHSEEE